MTPARRVCRNARGVSTSEDRVRFLGRALAEVAQLAEAASSNGAQCEFESRPRHDTDRVRRQMARDLLRLNSMVAGGRVIHQSPENALMGLRSLLKTARKRHTKYWSQHG